ncbi:MAG: DUF58 domain-containing protein [Pseudomonadota bacterium]
MTSAWQMPLRPSGALLRVMSGLAVLAVLIALCRIFLPNENVADLVAVVWLSGILLLTAISIYDAFNRPTDSSFTLSRSLPKSFPLNRPQRLTTRIENHSEHALNISLSDSPPDFFECSDFPLRQELQPEQAGLFEYTVVPKQRGEAIFKRSYVLLRSRIGLWDFIYRPNVVDRSKVFPDFSSVSSSFALGIEQAMRSIGAHLSVRRGDGLEFHQLREFREGDTLKQVDWKATARHGSPIAREYQEEKDQNIVFLLDCSRRMRASDKDLSYFDHCLNALLITSYVALDKGDAVGVMTFSGKPSWMSPVKGKVSINALLGHLYDLETSTQTSDFLQATEQLLSRHRKRSLIVLMTNLREESIDDLVAATEMLRKHHLVMVAVIREKMIEHAQQLEPRRFDDWMLYTGIKQFETARAKTIAKVRALGVTVVDAPSESLQTQLVQQYLKLKSSGQL